MSIMGQLIASGRPIHTLKFCSGWLLLMLIEGSGSLSPKLRPGSSISAHDVPKTQLWGKFFPSY